MHVVFLIRTAVELHRAWHMPLLTSKILQQIKDRFKLIVTWEIGVLKLRFRMDDGIHQLNRKTAYDYDSENQDIFAKIAVALVENRITIHQGKFRPRYCEHWSKKSISREDCLVLQH